MKDASTSLGLGYQYHNFKLVGLGYFELYFGQRIRSLFVRSFFSFVFYEPVVHRRQVLVKLLSVWFELSLCSRSPRSTSLHIMPLKKLKKHQHQKSVYESVKYLQQGWPSLSLLARMRNKLLNNNSSGRVRLREKGQHKSTLAVPKYFFMPNFGNFICKWSGN